MSLHAHNLFEFDQMDESITYYSEVAKQDEEGTAWMHLGNAYLKKDRLDDAIQAHHASLKLDPTDAIGWFNLACSYARKMQTVKACNALLVAFGIYRNHDKLMLDIKSDTDFDKIRNEPEFKKFISKSWEDLF